MRRKPRERSWLRIVLVSIAVVLGKSTIATAATGVIEVIGILVGVVGTAGTLISLSPAGTPVASVPVISVSDALFEVGDTREVVTSFHADFGCTNAASALRSADYGNVLLEVLIDGESPHPPRFSEATTSEFQSFTVPEVIQGTGIGQTDYMVRVTPYGHECHWYGDTWTKGVPRDATVSINVSSPFSGPYVEPRMVTLAEGDATIQALLMDNKSTAEGRVSFARLDDTVRPEMVVRSAATLEIGPPLRLAPARAEGNASQNVLIEEVVTCPPERCPRPSVDRWSTTWEVLDAEILLQTGIWRWAPRFQGGSATRLCSRPRCPEAPTEIDDDRLGRALTPVGESFAAGSPVKVRLTGNVAALDAANEAPDISAKVTLTDQATGESYSTTTGAEGKFELSGVVSVRGDTTLRVDAAPWYEPLVIEAGSLVFFGEGSDEEWTALAPDFGEVHIPWPTSVLLSPRSSPEIRGVVISDTGETLSGIVRVSGREPSGRLVGAFVDGRLRVPPVNLQTLGNHELAVLELEVYPRLNRRYARLRQTLEIEIPDVVDAEEAITVAPIVFQELVLGTDEDVVFSGRFIVGDLPERPAVQGLEITVDADASVGGARTATTDTDGTFELVVPAGTWTVSLRDPARRDFLGIQEEVEIEFGRAGDIDLGVRSLRLGRSE